MSDERLRLFVALELPEPIRQALARWWAGLDPRLERSLRPVGAEALHVTLCFLGWRAEDEVERIAAACAVVTPENAPELSLAEALWLPRRRPRVLAVQLVDRLEQLARIQSALSSALSAGGWYEPETRPYLAHVTVARVKGSPGAPAPDLPAPPRLEFHGRRVVLYRSRLMRGGARYEALASVELGPSTA